MTKLSSACRDPRGEGCLGLHVMEKFFAVPSEKQRKLNASESITDLHQRITADHTGTGVGIHHIRGKCEALSNEM